jgi:hypothetical protein
VRFLKSFEPCYYIKRASTGFLEFHFRSSTWRLWGTLLFSENRKKNEDTEKSINVSSRCYTCVLILLYMCPRTALHVSSYCYACF